MHTYKGHSTEGYALAWNPFLVGGLLSGDNSGAIKFWEPKPGGWNISDFFHNRGSAVEDLQFKKGGDGFGFIFASCGADGFVRIHDTRAPGQCLAALRHSAEGSGIDVNVLDWNPITPHLIVSGADDGSFKIFDTRYGTTVASPSNGGTADAGDRAVMAEFHYHRDAITSVQWHPTDEAGLAVSSADQQLSLWDMAVEDDENEQDEKERLDGAEEFPPQMLFLHQGQTELRESMWHPQLPGVVISTAGDSFNIFKPTERCQF